MMSNFFSAYRIDHILGFFRIWELPAHTKRGILGRFRPSIPIYLVKAASDCAPISSSFF